MFVCDGEDGIVSVRTWIDELFVDLGFCAKAGVGLIYF